MSFKKAETDRIERLEQMLLSLAKEAWIMRDRQKVLESLLNEKDILAEAEVDRYQPSPELESQLTDELSAFIDGLIFEPVNKAQLSESGS